MDDRAAHRGYFCDGVAGDSFLYQFAEPAMVGGPELAAGKNGFCAYRQSYAYRPGEKGGDAGKHSEWQWEYTSGNSEWQREYGGKVCIGAEHAQDLCYSYQRRTLWRTGERQDDEGVSQSGRLFHQGDNPRRQSGQLQPAVCGATDGPQSFEQVQDPV